MNLSISNRLQQAKILDTFKCSQNYSFEIFFLRLLYFQGNKDEDSLTNLILFRYFHII
jgi:hypothetical protein